MTFQKKFSRRKNFPVKMYENPGFYRKLTKYLRKMDRGNITMPLGYTMHKKNAK